MRKPRSGTLFPGRGDKILPGVLYGPQFLICSQPVAPQEPSGWVFHRSEKLAESGLSIGYSDLIGRTGEFLGYGYKAYDDYSATKKATLNRLVQSGVRRVYYPPAVDPSTLAYEWSWLRPHTTLAVVSGTSDYDLPDDFGRLVGSIHFPPEEYKRSVIQVSVSKILELRATTDQSGTPIYFATRFKESDGSGGQRQEVILYPEPDDDWIMPYEYEAYSGALSSTYPYPLGGMKLAELYIESCLAVAESQVNDEIGIHTQTYQALLVDAVARDRKNGAKFYGQMGNRDPELADFRRGYTGGTYSIVYNGVDL